MNEIETEENVEHQNWWRMKKYFLRQLLVSTGAWTCYFILGITFGATTVFIPQIRAEANSTEVISEDLSSWIPTMQIYAGVPWCVILPILMKIIGRKYTLMFVSISNLISFIIIYFSTTMMHIIIGQIINGINTGSHFTVSVIIIAEYTSPKHRGFFLTVKSATFSWGVLVSNAIGTFFHWKNIAIVGIACSIYSIIISILLPESPFWLSMKHRIEKCSKVHRWLKGTDKESVKELEQLINFKKNIDKNSKKSDFMVYKLRIITSEEFYKPLLLSILVLSMYVFSGKVVFSTYSIDIIRHITEDKEMSAYTGMLILDAVAVICMYIGCVFADMYSRRNLLISTSVTGILFLISISVYTYLIKLGLLMPNNYVSIVLMTGYSICIGCGSVILSPAIAGELVSVEHRALSSCCIDLSLKVGLGTLIKVTPYIFKAWGAEGAFLFYGGACSIVLLLIYKFLPETKDKTLLDIADLIKSSDAESASKEAKHFLTEAAEEIN